MKFQSSTPEHVLRGFLLARSLMRSFTRVATKCASIADSLTCDALEACSTRALIQEAEVIHGQS